MVITEMNYVLKSFQISLHFTIQGRFLSRLTIRERHTDDQQVTYHKMCVHTVGSMSG